MAGSLLPGDLLGALAQLRIRWLLESSRFEQLLEYGIMKRAFTLVELPFIVIAIVGVFAALVIHLIRQTNYSESGYEYDRYGNPYVPDPIRPAQPSCSDRMKVVCNGKDIETFCAPNQKFEVTRENDCVILRCYCEK
jgi:hypothetical protein